MASFQEYCDKGMFDTESILEEISDDEWVQMACEIALENSRLELELGIVDWFFTRTSPDNLKFLLSERFESKVYLLAGLSARYCEEQERLAGCKQDEEVFMTLARCVQGVLGRIVTTFFENRMEYLTPEDARLAYYKRCYPDYERLIDGYDFVPDKGTAYDLCEFVTGLMVLLMLEDFNAEELALLSRIGIASPRYNHFLQNASVETFTGAAYRPLACNALDRILETIDECHSVGETEDEIDILQEELTAEYAGCFLDLIDHGFSEAQVEELIQRHMMLDPSNLVEAWLAPSDEDEEEEDAPVLMS